MSMENTVYSEVEFSFESEFEEDRIRMVPSYREEDNAQNFTEGLMEALGYDYGPVSTNFDGVEMEKDEVEALVSEYGDVIFPKDQDGDLVQAIDEFKDLF